MSPRFDPRLYVIRLAWLVRRPAWSTVPANPQAARGKAARSRWSRPFPWRFRP